MLLTLNASNMSTAWLIPGNVRSRSKTKLKSPLTDKCILFFIVQVAATLPPPPDLFKAHPSQTQSQLRRMFWKLFLTVVVNWCCRRRGSLSRVQKGQPRLNIKRKC